MTSSVPIPGRTLKHDSGSSMAASPASAASSSWGSPSSTSNSFQPLPSPLRRSSAFSNDVFGSSPSPSPNGKGKAPVSASPPRDGGFFAPRRPSLMGSSLSRSEHTVIPLGSGDGPPRLITCVKSSQGFDWNQELFLPSYIHHDAEDLSLRQEPVQEIVLTEEEAADMLPR